MNALITCKKNCEKLLERELSLQNAKVDSKGPGWVIASFDAAPEDLCFAHQILFDPIKLKDTSFNRLGQNLVDLFLERVGNKRIESKWHYAFSSSGHENLVSRANTSEKNFFDKLRQKMSRVAKLAQKGIPHRAAASDGFYVHLTGFNETYVSFWAFSGGQTRMQLSANVPSRSFLKLEEAFHVFKHEPHKGDTVLDMGASPGGWSYSALQHGAFVTAVDNGPIKEPVKSHRNLTHLKTDALKFKGDHKKPVDWLLCDMLESPDIILTMLHQWIKHKWCHYFVVNVKLPRLDPIPLLQTIRHPKDGLAPLCEKLLIRQLYHDREEITLMGEVRF